MRGGARSLCQGPQLQLDVSCNTTHCRVFEQHKIRGKLGGRTGDASRVRGRRNEGDGGEGHLLSSSKSREACAALRARTNGSRACRASQRPDEDAFKAERVPNMTLKEHAVEAVVERNLVHEQVRGGLRGRSWAEPNLKSPARVLSTAGLYICQPRAMFSDLSSLCNPTTCNYGTQLPMIGRG